MKKLWKLLVVIFEYIETHNSEEALEYIEIYPYGGMSDIAIYDSEFDKEFWEQPGC